MVGVMINENEKTNFFKIYFEKLTYNKCYVDYYTLNEFIIKNDIINTIYDEI
jgi:hypothetical protein